MNDILFRASSIGDLMTDPRAKSDKESGALGETCKTKLRQIWREWDSDRTKEISSRQMDKGNNCEEDSIDLYCMTKKVMLFKNTERIHNEYVTGHPDLWIRTSLGNAEKIIDIKTSFDVFTFDDSRFEGVNKKYMWQLQTYMWLTGAKSSSLVYCLVNDKIEAVNDAKYFLAKRMNLIDAQTSPAFVKEALQLERNRIFDMRLFLENYPHANLVTDTDSWQYDIPAAKRIHEIEVPRDESCIELLKNRVPIWRKYIQETFINA